MALICFLLWSLFCSDRETEEDYRLIVANKPVKHTVSEWIDRAGMVVIGGIIILFVWMIFSGLGIFQLRLLLWIPAGWAMFTMGFRFLLNRKRGKDWRYVSPSNCYDRQWMKITSPDLEMDEENNRDWYIAASTYADTIHRAGTIAYIFEFTVLLASTIAYAWLAR